MSKDIVNKVAESGLVNLDLGAFYVEGPRACIDLQERLHEGLLLREKDFRQWVLAHDWAAYQNHFVAVSCGGEAIVPMWAYLLVAAELAPYAAKVAFGTLENLESSLFCDALQGLDTAVLLNQRVLVNGCSKHPVPPAAFLELGRLLQPIVKSLMFGEACSAVPIFKNR